MIKKILYIQGVTIMGGAPHSLIQLAAGLDRSRFRPYVVLGAPGILEKKLKEEEIKTYPVKMGMWRKGKSLPSIPLALKKISRIIKEEKIDLVHNNTMWDNPYGLFPARKKPVICHLRSPIRPDMTGKYFLSSADRLICISEAIKGSVQPELYPKLSVIYNGIDTGVFSPELDGTPVRKEFGIKPDEVLIGLVSRLDPLKGQETAIKALATLSSRSAKLILVGSLNETAGSLKRMAGRLDLADRVIFTGYREDIPTITAALDIAILPSLHEGFGRVIIEAMALRKPVVATDVGGIPEIIKDRETGFLIQPDNHQKLGEALEKLIDNPELRKRMGNSGYKRVCCCFSARRNIEATQQLYEEVMG
ncbi:MAG: glycosyltransferase family 4 protein [bacterium]